MAYCHTAYLLYVDDLSKQLIDARSGCFIEHQRINHVMYADDICLLSPSALGLQKLLDVCYSFSQCNDIVFNSLKSVYIVFRPKRYKLCCPTVSLHSDKLNRIPETEYLGYLLSKDQSDDEDIAKQIRVLSTYGLINYYECLVIVLSRRNCLEVIVHHCIVVPCGLIIEKYHIKN